MRQSFLPICSWCGARPTSRINDGVLVCRAAEQLFDFLVRGNCSAQCRARMIAPFADLPQVFTGRRGGGRRLRGGAGGARRGVDQGGADQR